MRVDQHRVDPAVPIEDLAGTVKDPSRAGKATPEELRGFTEAVSKITIVGDRFGSFASFRTARRLWHRRRGRGRT